MVFFYLGAHAGAWLRRTSLPLCISINVLAGLKHWDKIAPDGLKCRYVIDSGGFTQIMKSGKYLRSPKLYAALILRAWREIGVFDWAAIQDYMCEEKALRMSGLTIAQHIERTVINYVVLKSLAPEINWLPVIQGYELDDYFRCVDRYLAAGIDLTTFPVVGIGSVCARQGTEEIFVYLQALTKAGLKLHGFGVKTEVFKRVQESGEEVLVSADSMAWAQRAFKRQEMLPGCNHSHGNCASCFDYALDWRGKMEKRGLIYA